MSKLSQLSPFEDEISTFFPLDQCESVINIPIAVERDP